MKIKLDLLTKTLTTFDDTSDVYVGDLNADKLELYVADNTELLNEGYLSITGLLSNGRKIGHYTTDSSYEPVTIDGVDYFKIEFTLTKANGFTLSEGQLQLTIWFNETDENGKLKKREALGNVLVNVRNTASVDDVLIMTDNNGDVVFNFINELQNIQSRISEIDANYVRRDGDTLTGELYTEAKTPYLIGKKNKVGIRAQDETTKEVVGQFSISDTDMETYQGHWANMTAKGNDGNNYSIRVSKLGAQYKNGATGTTHQLATEDYVDQEITLSEEYVKEYTDQEINDTKEYVKSYSGVINLGEISNPNYVDNEVLNEVKTKGMYSFTFGGTGYLMAVKTGRTGQANTYKQAILGLTETIEANMIYREANSVRNEWTIKSNKIASTEYVNDAIKQLLGGDVDTAYDTFKEIQEYIEQHGTQASEMLTAINQKADKSYVDELFENIPLVIIS